MFSLAYFCLQVFGALASEPFKVSDGFYGTGETFMFTFSPDFEVSSNNFVCFWCVGFILLFSHMHHLKILNKSRIFQIIYF